MNKSPIVVVDSDGIVAQGNLADSNHKTAVKIAEKLVELEAKVVYPSCIVF